MKIVLATGGFDPIHSGHIVYFKDAAKFGHRLIVGINSDAWLKRKKGKEFMPWDERFSIISNLKMVDDAIDFNDDDNTSVGAIEKLLDQFPNDDIVFVNGGDRAAGNVPEQEFFKNNPRVTFVFGVGGDNKKNSSRWILDEWKSPVTQRVWGNYRVLYENNSTTKVKELVVEPGKKLSMQKHSMRNEHWFIAQGQATLYSKNPPVVFNQHESLMIPQDSWHQLANETDRELKVVEIQYGECCIEEDIIRK